jgi:hypothetical protein
MRDPKRIPRILTKLQIIWEHYPELRFGQLSSLLEEEFYTEDDALERTIDNIIRSIERA